MNSTFIWLLCALLLEACVWIRSLTDWAVKARKMDGFVRVGVGRTVVALFGACVCVLIMKEKRNYERFRDVAIELGLKVVDEHCGPVQKIGAKTYYHKMGNGGLTVERRFEDGKEFSVGISRDPIVLFVKH